MSTLQEIPVVSQGPHPNILPLSFAQQITASAIEKKQPHRNRRIVEPQAADTLHPLPLAAVVRKIGQRVIDESHVLPGAHRAAVTIRRRRNPIAYFIKSHEGRTRRDGELEV